MKRYTSLVAALLVLAIGRTQAQSQSTLYWDLNSSDPGATPGGNGVGDGTWDANLTSWNPIADGTGTPVAWTENNDAVFAAGNDLGAFPSGGAFVLVPDTRTPHSLTIKNGSVDFTGALGSIAMGSNPITVMNGALISIPS